MSSKKNKIKSSTPATNTKQQRSYGKNGKFDGKDSSQDGKQDNKKSMFGDWTGKTPITLLHEHCQKQGWEKAIIEVKEQQQKNDNQKGHVATVRLSKRNKKTAQLQTISLTPPDLYLPTAVEAKHAAATFALHRVNSHINMHHVLPPDYRNLWRQFESLKTSTNSWQYTPDPFSAQPPSIASKKNNNNKPNKEHTNAAIPMPLGFDQVPLSSVDADMLSMDTLLQSKHNNNNNMNSKHQRPPEHDMDEKMRRYWENLPTVHMTSENRNRIENIIRQSHLVYQTNGKKLSSSERQNILDGLVKMGFRPSHVDEALDYCSDTASALDWLCLHVPEDDLPNHFMNGSYNPKLTTNSHTTQSLGRDWLLKRMNAIGYPLSVCEEAMQQCNDDDSKALELLQWKLVHGEEEMIPPNDEINNNTIDQEELTALREDEIIALESVYESRLEKQVDQDQRLHYKILFMVQLDPNNNINKKNKKPTPRQPLILDIMIPTHSTYPYVLPVFMIQCEGLPSYLKLSMVQGLIEEGERNLGMPMIYMCVEWLQENADNMIAHPPKLRKITDGIMSTSQQSSKTKKKYNNNNKNKRRQQLEAESKLDTSISSQLKSDLEYLHQSEPYQPFAAIRSKLPAHTYKDKVIQAVRQHQVTIVSGETGCGKTTQVPQFILDEEIKDNNGSSCSIICTQPRKISAMGVAERVAAERCETIGKTVGYAIRGETKVSSSTRLQFVTTGVLLRRIHSDPTLKGISHVMIDEVHERSVDSDFLLIILKQLLKKRKDIKIVLMSATINQELFSNYFGGIPTIEIPGFTHPVEDFYLEDIVSMLLHGKLSPNKKISNHDELVIPEGDWAEWQIPYLQAGYDEKTVYSLARYRNQDKIDYDVIAQTVKYIVENENVKIDGNAEPAILIFMPGAMEIKKCVESLQTILSTTISNKNNKEYEILPLHANLSPQEQTRVFKPVKKNVHKIVVTTNVAETSITIEGVVYVIDSGRVKETQYVASNNMMHLVETWASKASCKQRRGRAGRTRPGKCFKLFTSDLESNKMKPQQVPELLRTPLEQLCLQVKSMGEQDVTFFLRQAIDPPSISALTTALDTLKAVDAIDDSDLGNLTPLGKHMANIPADLRISKMLLLGSIFKCLDPILTIAAIMSLKSPFVSPMEKREEARQAREKFNYGKSDWLTDMQGYNQWHQIIKKKGMKEARLFCEENYLSFPTMTEIQSLRKQYSDALTDIGFYDHRRLGIAHYNINQDNDNLLKSIIFGGLNPNLARIQLPDTKYDKVLSGTVEREKEAKEIKFYTKKDGRVFLHPSSILFSTNQYNASFLTYFSRMTTSKTFLRDGTEIPSYAVLFFGGKVDVDHLGRGLKVGEDGWIKFRSWARIGVLVNQLKRLLHAELDIKIQDPNQDVSSSSIVEAMVTLISNDGL